jgi:hypothetical protein
MDVVMGIATTTTITTAATAAAAAAPTAPAAATTVSAAATSAVASRSCSWSPSLATLATPEFENRGQAWARQTNALEAPSHLAGKATWPGKP